MYIYLNEEITAAKDAMISSFDHGYIFGVGAFEPFRTYERHPFLLDDLLYRLQTSLQVMGIEKHKNRRSHCKSDERKY